MGTVPNLVHDGPGTVPTYTALAAHAKSLLNRLEDGPGTVPVYTALAGSRDCPRLQEGGYISVTANQRREAFGVATTLRTAGWPGASFADGTVSVKVPYSSVVGSRW